MSKYLKKFDTHTEYEAYIGGEPLLPNVSICADNEDKNHVHYNPLIPPPPPQPNDEIWYTTTDGNMIELYEDGKCYGDEECTQELTILSHTYENGKGIIKFDGDIVSCGHPTEDEGLFEECENLLTCNLPNSCKIIGAYNFYYCESLIEFIATNSIISIGELAFKYCESLTSVILGDHITNISESAFEQCTNLISINIPNSITSISDSLFYDCESLISIIIPNSVTSIGESAFSSCSNLTSIIIPNSVIYIDSAFQNCTSLTSVTIPSSVTNIANFAFAYCTSLISITCLATVPPTVGINIFDNTNDCPIYVPSESVDAYKAATNWGEYTDRIFPIQD